MESQRAERILEKVAAKLGVSKRELIQKFGGEKRAETKVEQIEEPNIEEPEPAEKKIPPQKQKRRQPQQDLSRPPKRQGKKRRGLSDVGVTDPRNTGRGTGSAFIGRRAVVGANHSIFASNQSFVSGGNPLTSRPIFPRGGQSQISGGKPVSAKRKSITNSPILNSRDKQSISDRIFGR